MRHGLSYFQQTIIDLLPTFYRRVDTALANVGQPRVPLDHPLFTFGSWMGGDRDGNPNVTSDTTRDVCILARLEVCPYGIPKHANVLCLEYKLLCANVFC